MSWVRGKIEVPSGHRVLWGEPGNQTWLRLWCTVEVLRTDPEWYILRSGDAVTDYVRSNVREQMAPHEDDPEFSYFT